MEKELVIVIDFGGQYNPSSVVVLGRFRRFHLSILFICSPEPRFFPYLQQIFNALLELFY